MVLRKLRPRSRRAAAAVETAFVLIPLFLLLFGIFQYARLLMDWHMVHNAAREGCRYALVNNTSSTIANDVKTLVTNKMGSETAAFNNFTVTVSGTSGGVSTAVNNLVAGDFITVTVSGNYKFMSLPFVPTPSLTITTSVTMVCEGVM